MNTNPMALMVVNMEVKVKGEIIGVMDGETFRMGIEGSKDIVDGNIQFNFIGYEMARELGATSVSIYDQDTDITYEASVALIDLYGWFDLVWGGKMIKMGVDKWGTHQNGNQLGMFG